MATTRIKLVRQLSTHKFDLLVIGGGVTGAGIALDAVLRGLRVALIEKGDYASGTSSKSTKLIHGGLRYLKQFEFRIVAEVGRERAILHRLAPHLVRPEKMLLPIYEHGSFSRFSTSLGLWVYDQLARVKGSDRRRMLSAALVRAEEPLLSTEGLKAGGLYAEYRTDDARLTIEIVKTAVRLGCVALNYVEADGFITTASGKLKGVMATDLLSGIQMEVFAKKIVNAAGPWVDELRQLDHSLNGKRLFLSKGTHIVVPREKLPLKYSVYFDMPDGRMVFAIPRHRTTYIGTTDTPFTDDKNGVFASRDDAEYLLKGLNGVFPHAQISLQDVESSWAGLRPLIYEPGKSASEMSRKDEVFVSPSGLISIAGGKLTGYRKMAEKVVSYVVKSLGLQSPQCTTMSVPLTKGKLDEAAYLAEFEAFANGAEDSGFAAQSLLQNYGAAAGKILAAARQTALPPAQALVVAEAEYAASEEFVVKALDFFERRSGRLYFDIRSVEAYLNQVLEALQRLLGWSDEKKAAERAEVLQAVHNVTQFKQ